MVFVDGIMRMQNGKIPGVDIESIRLSGQEAGEFMWDHWHEWDPDGRTSEQMSSMSFRVVNAN